MTALSMAPALAGPIVLYTVVTSITPGPNNLMLLSSGVRFGVRRSVPHVMGISIGAAVMVALTGLGLAQLFVRWPVLHGVLQGRAMKARAAPRRECVRSLWDSGGRRLFSG